MIIRPREIYLIGVLFSIVIGYQLSAYFLYQYYKYKKEKLVYNKILLSYSVTIFLALTGYLLQVILEFYLEELLINQILLKISFLIFSLAVCYFLISILTNPYANIINRLLVQIVFIYIIIAMIFILFIDINWLGFIFRALAAFLGGFFVLLFQIKLIRLTSGNIKKSLILFTIGLIFALIGGIFSNKESYTQFGTVVYLISVFIILAGISIAFIGIYNFPAFLEFQWKENLQKLCIFEQEKFRILYSLNFMALDNSHIFLNKLDFQITKNIEELFSRGITGIEQITTQLLNSKEEKIIKIKQGDSFILLEHGDPPIYSITYGLLVEKDMYSLRYFLKEVKKQFQAKYKYILSNLELIEGNEEKFFLNFTNNIKVILE